MGNRLYVGSLPYTTTDAELTELFAQCGEVVSARVITDKYSGMSRGFGYVEYSLEAAAKAAAAKLNGLDMGGRRITVEEARPMTAGAGPVTSRR